MAGKMIAYGAVTERSVDGGTTWLRLPNCKGIAIPTVEQNYVDVTDLDSPNGYREYLPGLKDAGELSIPCNYTAAGYEMALADEALGQAILYRTTLKAAPGQAGGDVFEFSGFPRPQISETGDVEDPIEFAVVIRTTGDVTWTRGAAAA